MAQTEEAHGDIQHAGEGHGVEGGGSGQGQSVNQTGVSARSDGLCTNGADSAGNAAHAVRTQSGEQSSAENNHDIGTDVQIADSPHGGIEECGFGNQGGVTHDGADTQQGHGALDAAVGDGAGQTLMEATLDVQQQADDDGGSLSNNGGGGGGKAEAELQNGAAGNNDNQRNDGLNEAGHLILSQVGGVGTHPFLSGRGLVADTGLAILAHEDELNIQQNDDALHSAHDETDGSTGIHGGAICLRGNDVADGGRAGEHEAEGRVDTHHGDAGHIQGQIGGLHQGEGEHGRQEGPGLDADEAADGNEDSQAENGKVCAEFVDEGTAQNDIRAGTNHDRAEHTAEHEGD